MIDILNEGIRKKILEEIHSRENFERKKRSFIQFDIFNDNQHKYVYEYLRSQFSENTLKEMPIISSINLARRIVLQEASLYKRAPKREFYELSDEQKSTLEHIYASAEVNKRLNKANELYRLMKQCFVYIVPVEGEISIRVLAPFQVDVVPNELNPEKADVYIISAFDRKELQREWKLPPLTGGSNSPIYPGLGYSTDSRNNTIADSEDDLEDERFVVWTKDLNFVMNGKGEILSSDVSNPIGIVPVIEVSSDKNLTFWYETGQSVTDFSVQFNSALSDLANVVRMQGWGQAWLKGPKDLLPESIVVGVNKILKLPIDINTNTQTEFGFSTPNPDLAGSMQFIESLLAMFMSSRGIDPKTVSGKLDAQKNYSSGIERLLAMIERFEASREDYSVFERVENKIFEVFRTYINVYGGTEYLPDIKTGMIGPDAYVNVTFARPEMVKTESEELDIIQRKLELGLISRKEAIMLDRGVDASTAEQIIMEIESEEAHRDTVKDALDA